MRTVAVTLCVLAACTATASAAPKIDRAALISAASPNFAWDGEQAQAAAPQQSANGFDPTLCTKNSDYYCDVTLVKLDAAQGTTATLQFDIFDFSVAISDFDLSIFKSNAAGEPGEFIANGGNLSAAGMEETVTVPEAEPGYYMATVSYYFSPDAFYKGTIKGTQITPPPVTTPPPSTPGPGPATAAGPLPLKVAGKLGSARKATRKKAVTIRATATEAISNLSLALRDARGKVVASGKAASFATGTRAIRLKASRKLRRGRYSLVAIGVAGGAKRSVTQTVSLGA